MTDTILFEQHDGVAQLCFNRGSRHNALGHVELRAIGSALDTLADDTRVLLITSEGSRTFCAGADLSELSSGVLTGDQFQAVTNRIAALPMPTLCAISGNVFGGGVELAMSCDFRIGADDIMMRIPAAAIGLCYPIDGIEKLVTRLGPGVAKRLLVAAEELNAQSMRELGLLDWLASPSTLSATARDRAEQLAGLAPLAVRSMKRIIDTCASGSHDREQARALSELCNQSADLQEGLAAVRERRPPSFKGQ